MRVSGLVKRGDVFYFRRRVPNHLLELSEKPVITRSLRTKAYVTAITRHAQVLLELDGIFTQIFDMSKLDPEFAKTYFNQLLRQWMGEGTIPPAPPSRIDQIKKRLNNEDDDFRNIGSEHLMASAELGQKVGYSDVTEVETIGNLLLRTTLEHARRSEAIQNGRFDGSAFDPYFSTVVPSSGGVLHSPAVQTVTHSVSSPPEPPIIGDLKTTFEAFMIEVKYDLKRRYRLKRIYHIVTELFGANFKTHLIGAVEIRTIKETLASYPTNSTKSPDTRGKPMAKQIEVARKKGLDLLKPGTINTYLSSLRMWFGWCKENGYATQNPFEGAKVKTAKKNKGNRSPFEVRDLQTIFASPSFKGMHSHSQWRHSGDQLFRDMRYWVPLIAIHTGMRVSEICQLYANDVRLIDDVWCIVINEQGEQSVKSPAALRTIPIHSNLLNDWGFEAWLNARKQIAKPRDTLFVEVSGKTKGKFAIAISRWFQDFLQHHEIKRPDLVFHSFRHTFSDLLRNADVDEATMQVILGHANGSVTAKYGSGHRLNTIRRAIEKVKIPFEVPKSSAKVVD